MKILAYLFRSSPVIVSLAIVMSFVSGLGNASLVALAHTALTSDRALSELGIQFALLTLGSLSVSLLSQLSLSYLYRKAIFDWQVHMSEEILQSPLRQLETIGEDNILTVLMRDVSTIGASLLPLLPQCSNAVVVVCCLAYLCWLAWQPFLGTLVIIIIGVLTYRIALGKNRETLRLAREESSELYGHFRLLANGIKELKLHRRRRQAFIEENLKPSAASIQKKLFRWSSSYLLIQTWSKFLLLFVLGMVLFIFPSFMTFDNRILSGYILTLLYIRGMLTSIMAAVPSLARANIAYNKIESLGLRLNLEPKESSSQAALQAESRAPARSSFHQIRYHNITHTYYREKEDGHLDRGR